MWLGHIGRGGVLAVNVTNIGRAVPTFAVLTLLALAPAPFGLNTTSTLTALVLFALPPILTNTYVGMREVDPGAVDAARGMGMSGWQVTRRVELPLAVPLLMAGVRLAAMQVVATATIAALVAGGGLGPHHHRRLRPPGPAAARGRRDRRRPAGADGGVAHGARAAGQPTRCGARQPHGRSAGDRDDS